MKITYALFSTLLISSSVLADPDKLCKELIDFGNSVTKDAPISVTLLTNWSEFSKSCAHNNHPQGKKFCSFLINNTSTEFMQINISRVMECLSEEKHNMFNSDLSFDMATGEFTAYEIKGIASDVSMKINYSFGVEDENPELKITATKE